MRPTYIDDPFEPWPASLGGLREEAAQAEPIPLKRRTTEVKDSDEAQRVFKIILKEIEAILEEQPLESMWFYVSKYLMHVKHEAKNYQPDVRAFLEERLPMVLDILRDQEDWKARAEDAIPQHRDRVRQVAGQEALHHLADGLIGEQEKRESVEVYHVSWDKILQDQEHFKMEERLVEGVGKMRVLLIRIGEGYEWNEFIVPPNEQIMHKGGVSRVLLKLFAGAPIDILLSELPVNDIDAIACGDKAEAQRIGLAMGADIEGIELVENFDDMSKLLLDRDMDMNQAFMTNNGLAFTQAALQSARTGKIALSGGDRAIYGSEVMYYQGVQLAKNRGLFRLMKMVIEGKAREFDYTPLNKQIDLGIYWLVLARKLIKKRNGGELLRRFYALGKQMGQVHEGENNIYDVLDRAHEETPFFRFDEKQMDSAGHIRWLARKLFRVAERTFRMDRGFPSDLVMKREEFDTVPYVASLFKDQPSPKLAETISEEWPKFEQRCNARSDSPEAQLKKQVA